MNKKIVILVLTLCFGLGGFFLSTHSSEVVYFKIVSEEDGPLLSSGMRNWMAEKRNLGLHGYENDTEEYYELLIFDNRFEKIPYSNTSVNAFKKGDELNIVLEDIPATDEGDIRYNQSIYILLDTKPKSTHVYVNDQEYALGVEGGDWEITD